MSLSKYSGGSTTACAACKYQRKRCTKDCLLAPYFPQDNPKDFLNAHKLFGISNITKIIRGVEKSQRHIAMRNLIFHANARTLDPVGGVYRIVSDLKRKIESCHAQLNLLNQQIALCRSLVQQQQRQRQDLPLGCYSYGDLLEQEEEYFNVDVYDHQNRQQHQEMMQQQRPLNCDMFWDMPEQTTKVKLEEGKISDQEQDTLMRQDDRY